MNVIGFDRRDAKMGLGLFRMMLRDRFLGSALGLVWAVANPLLMLGIFTFVFGFVFHSRLPGASTSMSFVLWLISGYAPWLAISEGLSNSALSVAGNSSIIKNLAFKRSCCRSPAFSPAWCRSGWGWPSSSSCSPSSAARLPGRGSSCPWAWCCNSCYSPGWA